jgi:hypothetical protein
MDLVSFEIETALVIERCLHHFKYFERCDRGTYFFGFARFEVLTAVLVKIQVCWDATLSLGDCFPMSGRHYNPLECRELLTQPRRIISQKRLVFFGDVTANYNEKFVTFLQEREVIYNTKQRYHSRNMMHNFGREVQTFYTVYKTRELHTI